MRRHGPGPAAGAACARWRSCRPRLGVEPPTPGPLDRVHEFLPRRLDLAQPHRVRTRADPHTLAVHVNTPGRQRFWGIVEMYRAEFDSQVTDERPGARIGRDK